MYLFLPFILHVERGVLEGHLLLAPLKNHGSVECEMTKSWPK